MGIVLSVLDRLIEDKKPGTAEWTGLTTRDGLKKVVERDLEWMLNTRQGVLTVPANLAELKKSLITYGLPDFSNYSGDNRMDLERIRKDIEEAISDFEPRLQAVKVKPPDREALKKYVICFQIEARLVIEMAPKSVEFETELHIDSGTFNVKEFNVKEE